MTFPEPGRMLAFVPFRGFIQGMSIWGDRMWDRLLAALLACALLAPASAFAQSWLYEVRGGVLAHDIPIVAAGRYESDVSLNAELAFTPSLPLFGGAIRPVLGGSFTPNGQTSWVYLDAR